MVDFSGLKLLFLVDSQKISIEFGIGQSIIPVGPWIFDDRPDVLRSLWTWRCKNASSFFFNQPPTLESFSEYLNSGPISTRERILFLVAREELIVGHMGLVSLGDNCATIDNVLRGLESEYSNEAGIMQKALERMITWANETYGIYEFDLEVRSDNDKAIRFYERCGFARGRDVQFMDFRRDIQETELQSKNLSRIIMRKTLSPSP